MSPLFNTKILHSFIPIFERATKEVMKGLDVVCDGRDFDLLQYTSTCSAKMVHGTMVDTLSVPEEIINTLITNLEM